MRDLSIKNKKRFQLIALGMKIVIKEQKYDHQFIFVKQTHQHLG